MRITFLIVTCLGFYLSVFSQESVFVKGFENGNGLIRAHHGSHFVILPAHVTGGFSGDLTLIRTNQLHYQGRLLESFEPDLAILSLEETEPIQSAAYTYPESITDVLQATTSGFIEHIDEFGGVNRVPVFISGYDNQHISVVPTSAGAEFYKGMSGSLFYFVQNQEKVLGGMLMELEEDLKTGLIFQIDDIERILQPFFETEAVPPKKLGVYILKEGVPVTDFNHQFLSDIGAEGAYDAVSQIPNLAFLRKQFYSIMSGQTLDAPIPNTLSEALDEVVLGRITLTSEQNQNSLYVVRTFLEANLYRTSDFNLVKSLNVGGKGLNANFDLARDQSMQSLLNQLKNQFQ